MSIQINSPTSPKTILDGPLTLINLYIYIAMACSKYSIFSAQGSI